MPKRRAKHRPERAAPPKQKVEAATAAAPDAPPPDAATVQAKLKRLDALRKQAKALGGAVPAAKPKRRPRFSGSWGCG
jgi:hypothetical protein